MHCHLFKQTKSTNKNWAVFGEIQTSPDIDRMFNAFPLNLTSIPNPNRIPTGPYGIHYSPHFHPIPIPMVIPLGDDDPHTNGSPVICSRE